MTEARRIIPEPIPFGELNQDVDRGPNCDSPPPGEIGEGKGGKKKKTTKKRKKSPSGPTRKSPKKKKK